MPYGYVIKDILNRILFHEDENIKNRIMQNPEMKEIIDNVGDSCRETQIDTLIGEYINLTIDEINDPAWAFEQIQGMRGYNHNWSFNRRKATLTTVASQEFYNLPRDLDKILLLRQTTSPTKLRYLPDDLFYRLEPDPTATGNPVYYRLWEQEGLSTTLAVADTVTVSSSASDTSQKISVVGYNSSGYIQSEELSLNGLTAVIGKLTYVANKPIRISKSANTTGFITVTETSGATTILVLGPEERTARFKVAGLYPIPSSVISVYMEYFTRLRRLVNNTDVPDLDEKWIWVIRTGAMAKVYGYQGKESLMTSTQAIYSSGVRSMVKSDIQECDYIPVLSNQNARRSGVITYSDEGYGSYGLTF